MRARTIQRLLATMKDWRMLSKKERQSAIEDLHTARRLETDLGFLANAQACTKLIHLAEAVDDVEPEAIDEISVAFAKTYGSS